MKKILLSLLAVLGMTACSQAQKTEFDKEALSNVMTTTDKSEITFAEILEANKGKTIVIDIWASWCSDCIKGMPKLKELQKKNEDVVFLFISMDKNWRDWIIGIEKYELAGKHFLVADGMKGVFGKSIDLNWIPRYMIVDKTGKIALYKAIVADDEQLQKTLDQLNSKR